ncbi:TonB-dependent receptor [Helicobacter cholecystus]|uniref:TonB-dependent receptor n=1 Tax=Helicobacter cholecystus TaxID=45498 RepID=A0A3D8IY34_9HELI|nr:TonB-dependent receptor [Helicobacter cholecystus]RDU69880.1 TonB-dependent receptor [Helicobacter cholecystus]VEJ25736.1 TonB-dependent receptor [Helicobacter cholecystus]
MQNKIFNKSPFNTLQAHNASVKMEYFFTESTLSSISAFQKTDTLGNSYPGIFVQDVSKDGNYYDTTEFVQELKVHINYPQGIESLLGMYYKYLLLDNGMDNVPTGNAFPGLPPLYYNGNWRAIEQTHAIAFFSDVYIPYKQWGFNLGLRYQFYNTGIDVPLPPMSPLMPAYKNSISFHFLNPRVSVMYSFNSEHQLFFTFANSTKPAGFSKFPFTDTDTLPYKQEQIYTLEFGNHSRFLLQSLKFDSSLYAMIRENTQAYVGEGYNKSIANIGKAYAFGVDIELSYENSFLSTFLNANVGYSYFGDDEKNKGVLIIGGNPSIYDVRGLRTRFSPRASFNTGLDFLLFSNSNHRLTFSNLLSFSSMYYLDDFNRESELVQKPYVLWDISLIYKLFKHYEITFFAQNLTNSRYATSVLWDGEGRAYTAGNPFNVGAKVGVLSIKNTKREFWLSVDTFYSC